MPESTFPAPDAQDPQTGEEGRMLPAALVETTARLAALLRLADELVDVIARDLGTADALAGRYASRVGPSRDGEEYVAIAEASGLQAVWDGLDVLGAKVARRCHLSNAASLYQVVEEWRADGMALQRWATGHLG